jgi:hypothetical protein
MTNTKIYTTVTPNQGPSLSCCKYEMMNTMIKSITIISKANKLFRVFVFIIVYYLSFIAPGPFTNLPGLALVCSPSFNTCVPFTQTWIIPVEYWCGFS